MPRKSTNVLKFNSGEEANWYATSQGRRQTHKDGTISRSTGSKIAKTDPTVLRQLMEQAKRNATRSISIRVPIADIERAQQIAKKKRIGYQTVLKQAIRKGLKPTG